MKKDFESLVKAEQEKGKTYAEAAALIEKTNPKEHAEYIAKFN